MGLFRDLGRRAERFKQDVVDASEATHRCADCESTFARDWEACPECGGEDVVGLD